MTENSHPGFRIFVLGAGFSRPAGLPIASELYPLVFQYIKRQYGEDTNFSRDVNEYLNYCSACGYTGQSKENLNLEQFMSYLDIEHFLRFRGSDTWSQEGNESQLMVRKAIGYVIHDRTPSPDDIPEVYLNFAESLSIHDSVLTFNYDLVLENALEKVGKPFRRYPNRFKSINKHGGILDTDTEEVVLLKLHGSLDWFDDRHYLDIKNSLIRESNSEPNTNLLFNNSGYYGLYPLVDGILPEDDALKHIFCMRNMNNYYYKTSDFNTPLILSSSYVKFVYAKPILSFWNGLGRSGGYNLGVSVIGFSLPEHDDYIRIALYKMFENYSSWWDTPAMGKYKDYVRFVDYRSTLELQDELKNRYSFVDEKYSRFYYDGFDLKAINFLFNQTRTGK
ncbi:SIR2 family protein [Oxalobacter formigenes]|uniref:SIR2 family protein n=1 Tax=Oxalobacter formigenes TaxID=847 RepID=UPI0022AE82B5|nr:SIR2 family protein [Oxalobacter formigenes]WAW05111.1 SIR2 family protein [Oxalobacter formigenes]